MAETQKAPRYENKAKIRGNLTRDAEIRDTKTGRVANARVATNENRKNQQTGKYETVHVEYHNVTVWKEEAIADLERFGGTGAYVELTGKIHTSQWTAQDNSVRTDKEIVVNNYGEFTLLDGKPRGGASTQQRSTPAPSKQRPVAADDGSEIPF